MLLVFAFRGLGDDGFDEGLDDGGVEVKPSLVLQFDNGVGVGLLPVRRAGVNIAVVIISHGYDAGANGNILSLETLWIARAVPFLMVAADNIRDIRKLRDILQHTRAGDAVPLINGQLPRRQEGQLRQNQIGHRKLTDIMQERAGFNLRYLGSRQAQLGRSAGSIISHLLAVQVDFSIFNLEHFQIEITDFPRQTEIREI